MARTHNDFKPKKSKKSGLKKRKLIDNNNKILKKYGN
jgi:hypothetical protein